MIRVLPPLTVEQRAVIIKAAYRLTEPVSEDWLKGIADVASGVLEVSMTPTGFLMALRDAVNAAGTPKGRIGQAATREHAAQQRTAWENDVIAVFQQEVI